MQRAGDRGPRGRRRLDPDPVRAPQEGGDEGLFGPDDGLDRSARAPSGRGPAGIKQQADLRLREAAVRPQRCLVAFADRAEEERASFRQEEDPPQRFVPDRRIAKDRAAVLDVEAAEVALDYRPPVDVLLRVESA